MIEDRGPTKNGRVAEDLLVSDHAALHVAFDELDLAIERNDAVEAHARLDLLWARLGVHIRAEHLALFPAILSALPSDDSPQKTGLDSHAVHETIHGLRSDHDFFMHQMARAINILRSANAASNKDSSTWQKSVREIMAEVRVRLEVHNAVEEEKVYRWAGLLLIVSDQAGLASKVQKELENLPPRFKGN